MVNKHAPFRKKFARANHTPYITKTLRKAVMRRSQLETKYLKTKNQANFKLSKKHKNLLDSKEFSKTMRPSLFDKNSFVVN